MLNLKRDDYAHRRWNFIWLSLFSIVFLSCLAISTQAFAQDKAADLPPITLDEEAVNRIEKLAQTDLEQAKERAKRLKSSIEDEIWPHREFADKKNDQARQYRELEKSAEDNAKVNWNRAKKYAKEAKDPIFKDNKEFLKILEDSVKQSERDAKADEQRAKEYRNKAIALEQEGQEFFDDMAIARELIKRLDAIINKEKPEPEKDPDVSSLPDQKDTDKDAEVPKLQFELADVLGLWRYTDGDRGHFAIVQQFPDNDIAADDSYLEVHTEKRIWKGAMYARPTPEFPLMEFTYKPKFDEMNEDIPEWVRIEIENDLEWKLQIDEAGDILNPRLRVKFFPGEVKWPEDKNDEAPARVIGEGLPRVFELEPIDIVKVESLAQTKIDISLGPNHDPDEHPVEGLLKNQPFKITVTLPAKLAEKEGTTLKVKLKALNGGGDEEVTLTGIKPVGLRPVTYSHKDQLILSDCDFTQTSYKPKTGSWTWLLDSLTPDGTFEFSGNCIDLDIDRKDLAGEKVEFRYGQAFHQVKFHNSWVQRGVERHMQGFDRMEIILGEIADKPSSKPDQKAAAEKRLKMIENYLALKKSGKLTDLHMFYVGEAYLGETFGEGILFDKDDTLKSKYSRQIRSTTTHEDLKGGSSYFNPLVKAYLEGLSGKDLTPDAHKTGNTVIWTSKEEEYFIKKAIRKTGKRLGSDVIKKLSLKMTFGMYDGLIAATQAGEMYLVITGRDHMKNKKQPTWRRIMAAVNLGSQAILSFSNSNIARAYKDNKLRMRNLGKGAKYETGIIRKVDEPLVSLEKFEQVNATLGLPTSLRAAQRKSLGLTLKSSPKTKGGCGCISRKKKPADKGPAGSKAPAGSASKPQTLFDPDTEQFLRSDSYVKQAYGKGARIVDTFGKQLFPTQKGQTCNLMSVNYIIWKITGKWLPEGKARNIVHNIMWKQYEAGKRNLDFLSKGWDGIHKGLDNLAIRDYLRGFGAKVAEIPHKLNNKVRVRHIGALLKDGWHVKVGVNTPFGPHAVLVESIGYSQKSKGLVVRIYDSNIGRILEMPVDTFKNMLITDPKYPWGSVTAFRFD